jgi:hypothetical protein
MTAVQAMREAWARFMAWRDGLPERFQVSPLLLVLGVLALLVGWMAALGELSVRRSALAEQASLLRLQYERALNEEPEVVWRERRAEIEQQMMAAREEVVWTGPSIGVVSAQIQSRLAGIADQAGLPGARVEVGRSVLTESGVDMLEITLTSGFGSEATRLAIQDIERASPMFRIMAAEISSVRPRRLVLVIRAPVNIDDARSS